MLIYIFMWGCAMALYTGKVEPRKPCLNAASCRSVPQSFIHLSKISLHILEVLSLFFRGFVPGNFIWLP